MNTNILALQAEKALMERLLIQAESSIYNGPQGTIYTRKSRDTTTFFHVTNQLGANGTRIKKQTYISLNDQQFIQQLLEKRLGMRNLPKLKNNIKVLERCIKQYKSISTGRIYTAGGGFYIPGAPTGDALHTKKIITPYMCDSWSPEVKAWMEQPVKRNTKNLEDLKHLSSRGILTRSKSEAAIATMLESHYIPYKYDCLIELDGGFVSPDFMIMRPRDGLIIFWEHYGLVMELKYAQDMNRKRTLYLANDITPWYSLIESYDDGTGALDLQIIEGLIKAFIL